MSFIQQHKKVVIFGAMILILGYFIFNWLKPTQVAAYEVAKQDYVPSLLLSGEVISEGSTLLSTLVSGKVLECPVTKGDQVNKGQLLMQIDDAQARLDRDRAAAAVHMARSQLQKAGVVTREAARVNSVQADLELEKTTAQYTRIKTLAEAGAVSQTDLEQAERNLKLAQELAASTQAALNSLSENGADIAILQSELQQRQLDLQEKEMLLNEYKILAPADGEVLDLYVLPGENLSTGSKVALLASGQGLRIKIQPDQRYAALAALGNKAQVWLANAATAKWDAQVVYTEPIGNAEQGSFTAELAFSKNVSSLYPGQLLSVQLFAPSQPDAIILPDSYLTVQNGQNGVWLAIDNRAHFTPLQIGLRTNDGVVITQGLKVGDLILNPTGLQENQKVTPSAARVR